MKRLLCIVTAVLLLFTFALLDVSAADDNMSFLFDITSDGKSERRVEPGDIITVTLKLKRTDKDSTYTVYAMQDELRYDSRFLELIPDSCVLETGVVSTDIAMVDNHREFYMNYLSLSGGAQWKSTTQIGSVQFKVIGESGVTKISNQDYLVSFADGSGSYDCVANDLTLIISGECTVSFESNGGSAVPDAKVIFGEKIPIPEVPVREGYDFVGWFSDIHLTDEWDFENDTVESNMTLYAKWNISSGVETTMPGTDTDVVGGDGCKTIDARWIVLVILIIAICIIILNKKRRDSIRSKGAKE